MWKTHARHLPLLCPLRSCRALSPSPFSLLRPSSPCCPSLLLCSLAGIPPVQHKRYAKLFIRIAPQGELKGAGQARGVQQFKKICETVCVSLYVCLCVWVWQCVPECECAQGLERTSQAVPSRAQLMLIFCGCCCCPRGNLNSAINVWVIRSIHDWYE